MVRTHNEDHSNFRASLLPTKGQIAGLECRRLAGVSLSDLGCCLFKEYEAHLEHVAGRVEQEVTRSLEQIEEQACHQLLEGELVGMSIPLGSPSTHTSFSLKAGGAD